MTTFGDQVFEFGGSPVSGGRFSSPWAKHYFVDSIDGQPGNGGLKPNEAVDTIQGAVDLATRGDVIYIRPGVWNTGTGFDRYTEDVTITSGQSGTDMTNSNISIIGVSAPGSIGDFVGVRWKYETATNLTNDAPALHLEKIGFFSEGATYAVLLRHNGATLTRQGSTGTSFYDCHFKGKGLYVLSGGDGLSVIKCRFQCAYTGTVAQLNYSASANPGRRLTVMYSDWLDGNGVAPDGPCISIAPPCTEILIKHNTFPQQPTSSGNVYISAAGASNEGLIANNWFASANLDTDANILPGGCFVVDNYDVGGRAATT